MPLTNQKIEQFRRSVQLALNQEWPELAKIRRRLASVVPKPINCDAPPNLPASKRGQLTILDSLDPASDPTVSLPRDPGIFQRNAAGI